MGDLRTDQVKLACDLMAELLSEQGFNKMRDIMLADDQLLDQGRPRNGFGTENFAVVIFGVLTIFFPCLTGTISFWAALETFADPVVCNDGAGHLNDALFTYWVARFPALQPTSAKFDGRPPVTQ